VHTLAHTVGALRAAAGYGRGVVLVSAAGAGAYAGPGWFSALVDAAREAVPGASASAFLDCAEAPGAALAAIRMPVEGVIFTGCADVARRLADLALRHGVRFLTRRPEADLDLIADFFASETASEKACIAFFAKAD
jgi:hypothetical protein